MGMIRLPWGFTATDFGPDAADAHRTKINFLTGL
jgi:hypothetical protein